MTELINIQISEIFIMLYSGFSIMLIFETRNRIINTLCKNKRISIFVYLCSWLLASYVFYKFLYKATYGVLSPQGIAATLVGILLWKKFIYGIIDTDKVRNEKEVKRQTTSQC